MSEEKYAETSLYAQHFENDLYLPPIEHSLEIQSARYEELKKQLAKVMEESRKADEEIRELQKNLATLMKENNMKLSDEIGIVSGDGLTTEIIAQEEEVTDTS